MQPENQLDLTHLCALHAAATQGEWQRHPNPKKWVLLPIPEDADPNNDANAEWCCSIHNAFPDLCAELEALRARVAELERGK